jgi:hypothetical protein
MNESVSLALDAVVKPESPEIGILDSFFLPWGSAASLGHEGAAHRMLMIRPCQLRMAARAGLIAEVFHVRANVTIPGGIHETRVVGGITRDRFG